MNTYAQAAEKLGVKFSQLKHMVKKRRISVVNLGHKTKRITNEEISRIIQQRTQKAII